MGIEEVDQFLRGLEFSARDLTGKYEGKQSARLFTSNVWVVDHLETKIKKEIAPMKKELEALGANSTNTVIQNNAVISIQHLQEIERCFNGIMAPYNNNLEMSQIEKAWGVNLQIINEKLKSLRHRIDIIKNSSVVSKKRIEEEDWYNNL